jgi:hypothetical protein
VILSLTQLYRIFYNLHWNNYLYFKGLLYIWEEIIMMALLHMAGLENSRKRRGHIFFEWNKCLWLCFLEYFKILSAVYWWREEDPFHFWRFSLLPFQSYWTWYDGK